MQIRLPGDYNYTSNTYSALNKPNVSANTAAQTAGATLGSVINGASPPATKPPATSNKPTDQAAAAATIPGNTIAHQNAQSDIAAGRPGFEPIRGG